MRTAVVPDRFVAGEETALVQFLNGGGAGKSRGVDAVEMGREA